MNQTSTKDHSRTQPRGGQAGQLYDVLFEETHDFAFLLDANGFVVEANDRVCEFTDSAPGEIIGARFWNTPWYSNSNGSVHRIREELQRAVGGERIDRECQVQGADRTAFVDVSIRPVPDSRGVVEFLFLTAAERTEHHRRLSELEARNDSLEEFVRVVSHDIRELLGVATGNLRLAAEATDLAELETALRSLDRIEDLLGGFSATVRDGELIGDREELNLGTIANEAWRHTETPEASLVIDSSTTVRADETRLMEVFENLYRNAVEHAGPAVAVRVGTTDEGFYVEDDGPGLPADTDPFEPGVTTSPDGMGLGLAIVETVLNAHGWSIRATEGSAGGARFEVDTGA